MWLVQETASTGVSNGNGTGDAVWEVAGVAYIVCCELC